MPLYRTPGIYIEETQTGARPIEAVGTSTAGFVGLAPSAAAHPGEAVAINNWLHFCREFVSEDSRSTPLAQAVYGFFENGGRRCYVVNLGEPRELRGGGRRREGLDLLREVDEVAIVAAPGMTDAASYDALLSHCEDLKDRVAVLDAPADVDDLDRLTRVAEMTAPEAGPARAAEVGAGAPGLRPRQSDGGYGAAYFPWFWAADPLARAETVLTPPSGHVAGIFARSDALRGVHKAPANEAVRGAGRLAYHVTAEEQGMLNQSGVNVIRSFPREGIRVWGARTLAASSSEWRYLNVRRLFNMIEESIANSTKWVVFEPNDVPLWKAIRRDVGAFLTRLWRDGALVGQTAEEAFFVKCDTETNPPDVVDAGQVITMIGIAPVKPAEFIVFRIGQQTAGAKVETEGTTHG